MTTGFRSGRPRRSAPASGAVDMATPEDRDYVAALEVFFAAEHDRVIGKPVALTGCTHLQPELTDPTCRLCRAYAQLRRLPLVIGAERADELYRAAARDWDRRVACPFCGEPIGCECLSAVSEALA
jgi:hypothetical protein